MLKSGNMKIAKYLLNFLEFNVKWIKKPPGAESGGFKFTAKNLVFVSLPFLFDYFYFLSHESLEFFAYMSSDSLVDWVEW